MIWRTLSAFMALITPYANKGAVKLERVRSMNSLPCEIPDCLVELCVQFDPSARNARLGTLHSLKDLTELL